MVRREEKTGKIKRKKRREEKTENIERNKRRRESSSLLKSTPSFPLDLTSEIFIKLPAKSVVRFRCVSKLWSTITTEPYFTNTFETRPRLLLFFKQGDKLFVFSVSQHNQNPNESYSYYSSQPIDSYQMTFPKRCSYTANTESVHGLICFKKSATPIVWNPTMRKFLALPKLEKSWKGIAVFFGYDPMERKHKIMCMPSGEKSSECRVLTLGTDKNSWKRIKTNYNHRPSTSYRRDLHGRCINGVVYYQAQLGSDLAIMSFDVRSEKFSVIRLPWEGYKRMSIIPYQRRLACVGSIGNSISVWVLEDAEKLEWSNHIFLPLSHYDQGLQNFRLMGITDDGEFIYAQSTVFKSFPVIYIHPMRNTFRKVEYRGIADEDFRQRNGLGDKLQRGLQLFPNHIETLSSF